MEQRIVLSKIVKFEEDKNWFRKSRSSTI